LCTLQCALYPETLQKRVIDKAVIGVLLLVFIFMWLPVSLQAQNHSEDYISVKNWKLPESSVKLSELERTGDIMLDDGKAFSGWAFERNAQGQLVRAAQYKEGLQDGLSLMWYADGSPQMSASYRAGSLHGRFLGWYTNGNVIYDMVINRGAYASDNLAEQDGSRLSSETEIYEGEGRDNDNTPE